MRAGLTRKRAMDPLAEAVRHQDYSGLVISGGHVRRHMYRGGPQSRETASTTKSLTQLRGEYGCNAVAVGWGSRKGVDSQAE